MYVCVSACKGWCVCISICLCVYMQELVCLRKCMFVYAHVCDGVFVCVCVYMCMYMSTEHISSEFGLLFDKNSERQRATTRKAATSFKMEARAKFKNKRRTRMNIETLQHLSLPFLWRILHIQDLDNNPVRKEILRQNGDCPNLKDPTSFTCS